ncbi:HNH endonuclease signature motif containing protein [Diaminobutyricimonas sp. LJ205]|uniref:HNH endonuclease n=1 Tax=Diaminobutyricimonas sp. LJ205 TaxID=2683590 RepID=UPI0012F4A348|nr:HNH endonuclease signature motif containing protein [Diaminobutyricimonas sp. LJ205]
MGNEANGWGEAQAPVLAESPLDSLSAEQIEAAFQARVADLRASGWLVGRLPRDPFTPQAVAGSIPEGIQRIVRMEQEQAELEARKSRELANLARMSVAEAGKGADRGLVYRSLAAELAMAAHLSERTFQARINDAETLVQDFPRTLAALETGTIGVGHARVIIECGLPIGDPTLRATYESAVIDRAVDLTPGRLRKQARLAATRLAEVSFEDRHQLAVEDRAVRLQELDDGMSEIIHTLPTVFAVPMLDRLTEQAKAIKAANPDEPRTLDQIRSDLMCELVLTRQPSGCPGAPHAAGVGIRAEVSIVIPALTLLGQGDEPATIAGRGPIGMAEALKLAAQAPSLIRLLTDPVSGQVLAADTYRPSKKLRRFIRGRDRRCRCPWCTRTASHGDLDHTLAWEHGGTTTPENLALLCRGCHILKHFPGWSVKQISPGVLEWSSPHGIVATDYPDTPITFQ